jgi:uncharacterized damage-inducible protein DinB
VTGSVELLTDAFERIRDEVRNNLKGVDDAALTFRPGDTANSAAWLIWHLTRVQDDHVAEAFDRTQVWIGQGWMERFGLPFTATDTGYGHSSDEVGKVAVTADLLLGYHEAVCEASIAALRNVTEEDLERVVDDRWDPPVTLAVRLVSVISDDLQHVGQAAYALGIA